MQMNFLDNSLGSRLWVSGVVARPRSWTVVRVVIRIIVSRHYIGLCSACLFFIRCKSKLILPHGLRLRSSDTFFWSFCCPYARFFRTVFWQRQIFTLTLKFSVPPKFYPRTTNCSSVIALECREFYSVTLLHILPFACVSREFSSFVCYAALCCSSSQWFQPSLCFYVTVCARLRSYVAASFCCRRWPGFHLVCMRVCLSLSNLGSYTQSSPCFCSCLQSRQMIPLSDGLLRTLARAPWPQLPCRLVLDIGQPLLCFCCWCLCRVKGPAGFARQSTRIPVVGA